MVLIVFRGAKIPQRYNFVIMVVGISPHFLAGWIAITRVIDYHHHYSDIIAGAVIGIAAARIAYHANYPPGRITVQNDDW
jgi:membrane-associated phospholipid phosphatase